MFFSSDVCHYFFICFFYWIMYVTYFIYNINIVLVCTINTHGSLCERYRVAFDIN